MNIGHYAKSITYIVLAAVTFLVTALSDDAVTGEELVNLGVIVLGAIGVYLVPNFPEGVAKYWKTAITAATAALVAVLSFWSEGISTTEWLQIGIAALAAIGVYIVPNEPKVQKVDPV
jgi:hypothetical protein